MWEWNTCERIAKVAMQLNPVELITPTNAASEKKAFIKTYENGFSVNPSFLYQKGKLRQAVKAGKELEKLLEAYKGLEKYYPATKLGEAQEAAVKNIILDRINDAIVTSEMAQAILDGDDSALAELSIEKYGAPTCEMFAMAYRAATDEEFEEVGQPAFDAETIKYLKGQEYDAEEIMYYFTRVLELYGIEDWIVVIDDKATAIDVRDKNLAGRPMVVIPVNRKVNGMKLLELIGHEIECHLRSSENSRYFWSQILTDEYQPLVPLLAKSDNEFLYEGYAKKNDVCVTGKDGVPTPNYLLAMDQARRGESFATTFEAIAGFEIQNGTKLEKAYSKAWTATYRVFRGATYAKNDVVKNGYLFTKDFAYFGGYHLATADDHLDFSSMALRDVIKLEEAGIPLEPHYEHKWICLDPWRIGLL